MSRLRSAIYLLATCLIAVHHAIFTLGCTSDALPLGSFVRNDDQGWSIAKYTRADIDKVVEKLRSELGVLIDGHVGVERNSTGTEIFLYAEDIVLTLDRRGVAGAFRKPGQHARLNDKHNFVSWYLGDGRLSFSSGKKINVPYDMNDLIFSPGSGYFLITRKNDSKSLIYSVEKPTVVQAEVELANPALSSGREFLYIAGNDPSDTEEIKVYIYRRDEEQLQLEGIQIIDRPSGRCCSTFYVSDIHADKEVIAFVDSSDRPLSFLSKLYVFKVKDNGFSEAGKPGPYVDLFLEDDIISEYLGK